MDILDINGDEIRKLREGMGWTRGKLSEESGVSERTIQDIETGVSKNPGIFTMRDIIKGLPNYPDARRNDLILKIHSSLTTLDYNELRAVMSSINDLIELSASSRSKTALTD